MWNLFLLCWIHTKRKGVKMAQEKRLKWLLPELEGQGFRLKEIKAGWIAYPPDKTKPGVTIHKTPSDTRAWENMLARLRQSGYIPKAK